MHGLAHPAPHIVALLREYSDAAIRRAEGVLLGEPSEAFPSHLLRCERRSAIGAISLELHDWNRAIAGELPLIP